MATHAEKLIEFLVKALYSIKNDHWRTAYVSQGDLSQATESITTTIAKLSTVNKELVMVSIYLSSDLIRTASNTKPRVHVEGIPFSAISQLTMRMRLGDKTVGRGTGILPSF